MLLVDFHSLFSCQKSCKNLRELQLLLLERENGPKLNGHMWLEKRLAFGVGCVRASATTLDETKGISFGNNSIHLHLLLQITYSCLFIYMLRRSIWRNENCDVHISLCTAHCTCGGGGGGGAFDFLILCIKSRPPHCIDQSSRLQISMPFWTSMADAAGHGFLCYRQFLRAFFAHCLAGLLCLCNEVISHLIKKLAA